MSKKLILNSISGAGLYFINIVVAFIMSPVIIRILGNREYGLWELIISVIGYMGLLDLGIGPAMVRFIALSDAKKDHNDLRQTISTAFSFFLVVGTLALLLFLLLGLAPHLIAGSETLEVTNLGIVFCALGVNAALLFPLQVFITALMGVQRHFIINSTRGILMIIRAVLTFKLLHIYPSMGLIVLAMLEPIFTVVQFVVFATAFCRDKALPGMALSAVSWFKMKELFGFGFKSMTMLVASRIQNQTVPIIIGNIIGLGSIVYFVIPNRLVDYAKKFSNVIGYPLLPYLSASTGDSDFGEFSYSWLKTTLVLQVVSFPILLFILFCGEKFLSIWIGPDIALSGRWVMYCLLVGMAFESLSLNSFRLLMAKNLHGKNALIWLVLAVFSIPLGVLGAYLWDVVGVALGVTFVTVLGNIVTLLMSCSVVKISLMTYLRYTMVKLILPLTLLTASLWLTIEIFPAQNYSGLLFQILLSGTIYCLAIWAFTLNHDDRKQINDYFRIKSLRFKRP